VNSCDKFWGAELHINSSTLEIMRVPFSSPAATTFPLPIYHTTTTMSREALRSRILNVNYLPPPLILSSPPSSPKNVKNKVPSATSWTITLAQSTLPPDHLRHLQWCSTDLSLYLMCLHLLLKLHQQFSTLTIIIAPQMKHILSQPGQSRPITRPSGVRKC